MSGISFCRAGATALLVACLFATPLTSAAATQASDEASKGDLTFASFIMGLLDGLLSEAEDSAEAPTTNLYNPNDGDPLDDGEGDEAQSEGGDNGPSIDPTGGN